MYNQLQSMRNRQIIQYLIYPKIFNAYSVQYKGTFCVAFTIHQIQHNQHLNHAYPSLHHIDPFFTATQFTNHTQTLHQNQDFSYETEKFEIVFEQDEKSLKSMCVFRLQFDLLKSYKVFLSAKLLRKSKTYSQEQIGFCTSKRVDNKYEMLDEQVYQLKKEGLNLYERIMFRNCEFFSSVDTHICTFNLGYKLYKDKMQISNYYKNVRSSKESAKGTVKDKMGNERKEEINQHRESLLEDYANSLPSYYYELLNIYHEYQRCGQKCLNLYNKLIQQKEIPRRQRKLRIPNLEYVIMKSNKINLPHLSFHYETEHPATILILILEVLQVISQEKQLLRKNVKYLREVYCNLIISMPNKLFAEYTSQQGQKNEEYLQKTFVRYQKSRADLKKSLNKEIRQQLVTNYFKEVNLPNNNVKKMPILIVQNYDDGFLKLKTKSMSLTVFVHGYQGNSFDFQKSRNYLKMMNKQTQILVVESITDDMNDSILSLGQRVAKEVKEHIRFSSKQFKVINFIGFSLGGVIARSAFTLLEQLWPIFGVFITFSSPHLGLSQSDNNLVNLGVWFLIKIDNVKNLKELNFQSVKFEESLISKLSVCQGLSSFKKVVLVCSKDDGFVPFYSTVLDENQCQKQKIKDLCLNMLTTIRRIERVELVFNVESAGTFDKLTGRKGHIQFLDNDHFLQTFFRIYGRFL